MSKEKIIRCDICGKIVDLENGSRKQKIETVNGMCWDEFGYSIGGWGRRQNFTQKFEGEVCNECFYTLKSKIDELIETIKKRKNSCYQGVCIYGTSSNKTTGDNVPDLQSDELQPERHKKPLLRLLSYFL